MFSSLLIPGLENSSSVLPNILEEVYPIFDALRDTHKLWKPRGKQSDFSPRSFLCGLYVRRDGEVLQVTRVQEVCCKLLSGYARCSSIGTVPAENCLPGPWCCR